MQHVGFILASEVSALLIPEIPGNAEKEYYTVVFEKMKFLRRLVEFMKTLIFVNFQL